MSEPQSYKWGASNLHSNSSATHPTSRHYYPHCFHSRLRMVRTRATANQSATDHEISLPQAKENIPPYPQAVQTTSANVTAQASAQTARRTRSSTGSLPKSGGRPQPTVGSPRRKIRSSTVSHLVFGFLSLCVNTISEYESVDWEEPNCGHAYGETPQDASSSKHRCRDRSETREKEVGK